MKRKILFVLVTVLLASIFSPFATFASGMRIVATLEGLDELYTGAPVSARIVFTLEEGAYEDEIFPEDFFVFGLPSGLVTENAVRNSDTVVSIRITGSPTFATAGGWNLSVPSFISPRNIRRSNVWVPVTAQGLRVGTITASADVWTQSFTFDLNPLGTMHHDINVFLNTRGYTFRYIRYGSATLREDTDFIRYSENHFTINRSFLSRLAIGEWDLTFIMNLGANPTVRMNIIDTSIEAPPPEPEPIGPPPVPPITPTYPDESFMYLTGGIAVNLANLRWDLDRARVTPEFFGDTAEITVRTHVLDYMSFVNPDARFEIITPMARISVPLNILDLIFGGRAAIVSNELDYDEVDLRISVIDQSENDNFSKMFEAVYPQGELLSALVEFKLELVVAETGEVIHTASELSAPVDITYVVMDNAGHLRPAGFMFQRAWLEFVPYSQPSPNQITTSTIFPGVQAVMHNRVLFDDVLSTHWGFVQSYTAAYSGLVAPMDALMPDTPITRGEFAQLLSFVLQLPRADAGISGFADVPPSNVYFDGVSRLFNAGLLGPFVEGNVFRPNAIITREEIAAIVGMALILGDPIFEPEYRPLSIAFTDTSDFNPNHLTNVQATVNYGVMVGYPDHSFRPQGAGTRIYALEASIRLARALGVLDEA